MDFAIRYTETINLLYTTNTFCCHDPRGIIHLADALLPQRLAVLESIYIDMHPVYCFDSRVWEECCEILAAMPRLRKLVVKIETYGRMEDYRDSVVACLDTLVAVKQPREFEVLVERVLDGYGDAPFRMKVGEEVGSDTATAACPGLESDRMYRTFQGQIQGTDGEVL